MLLECAFHLARGSLLPALAQVTHVRIEQLTERAALGVRGRTLFCG